MHKYFIIAFATIMLMVSGCTSQKEASQAEVQSRAYVGHENDRDIHNFIQQYPAAAGTRLDDCQTCHRGGVEGTDTEREYSPCSYCHLIEFSNPGYQTGVPENFEATLNSYGIAYKQNGRNVEALASTAGLDSDSDGFTNSNEIAEKRYPGNADSQPGQPLAPILTLDWNRIQNLPPHSQFILMNRTTQQYDAYNTYKGVRVKDLLDEAKINLDGVTGITVFAPDGYSIDYTIEEVLEPFPKGYFYTEPGAIEDEKMRLIKYPEMVPEEIVGGNEIPGTPWLLLAYEQNGTPLEVSHYEKGSGYLVGEGPYRLIKPMRDLLGDASKPGRPDRSAKSETYGDGWDYVKAIDHNAGNCVRGATVIRLNPIPAGFEEYDWKNGWPLVNARQIVIFGKGVQ